MRGHDRGPIRLCTTALRAMSKKAVAKVSPGRGIEVVVWANDCGRSSTFVVARIHGTQI
jgi:hypothetical protein